MSQICNTYTVLPDYDHEIDYKDDDNDDDDDTYKNISDTDL